MNLQRRADRIEQFCEQIVLAARGSGLTFEEGAVAAMTLAAAMTAMSTGMVSEAQVRTMMREVIERELEKLSVPLAGKMVRP